MARFGDLISELSLVLLYRHISTFAVFRQIVRFGKIWILLDSDQFSDSETT